MAARPLSSPARFDSVAVARQLAIEDAHHRLEEQALALGARMAVVGVRRLHARDDLVGEHLERPAGAQREHLVAADALEPVEAPVRLRHRRAGDEDAVVLHEDDRLAVHRRGQALAFGRGSRPCRCSRRRRRSGRGRTPRSGSPSTSRLSFSMLSAIAHVWWVCSTTCAPVMRWIGAWMQCADSSSEPSPSSDAAVVVEDDQVAGARLRPVQAEGQDQVLARASRARSS